MRVHGFGERNGALLEAVSVYLGEGIEHKYERQPIPPVPKLR